MPDTRQDIDAALKYLSAADPVMKGLIREIGPCQPTLEKNRFRMLVRSIIGQQLSTRAARTIHARLENLAGAGRVTPENILGLTPETPAPGRAL
jgi:DNA-3-methyladenine glycosylase II